MRTPQEIETEIAALKALKPVGPFRESTGLYIATALIELEEGIDDTAAEWSEMSGREQDASTDARLWRQCVTQKKPSEGWGQLVK